MSFAGGEAACAGRSAHARTASERVPEASPAPCPANHAVAIPVRSPICIPIPIPISARRAPP